jgi:ribosomal protein L16/L10AE
MSMNVKEDSEIDADQLENARYSKKNHFRDEKSRGNPRERLGTLVNVKEESEIDADQLENAM